MGLFGNSKMPTSIKGNNNSIVISFFEHLKTYVSYYTVITAVIGILWTGFVIYDNWRDNNQLLQNNIKNIINTQKRQIKTDSLLLDNQIKMKADIDNLKTNGVTTIENMNALQRSYIRYISNDKALTKQDFLEYMEGLSVEEKKSSSGTVTNK